jgi:hypothetical protein
MKVDLVKELVASVILQTVTIFILLFSETLGFSKSQALTIGLGNLVVILIILYLIRGRIRGKITTAFANMAINKYGRDTGLAKVYENYIEAEPDIKECFEKATKIRIFMQIGRGVIGGNRSLLFESAQAKKEKGVSIQILYADQTSPYLSRERAKKRNSNYIEWETSIQYTEGNIKALLEDEINIAARKHCEPYLWRLFIFDDVMFVIPYTHNKNNHEKSHTFKLERKAEGAGSLYDTFSTYFDELWIKRGSSSFTHTVSNQMPSS